MSPHHSSRAPSTTATGRWLAGIASVTTVLSATLALLTGTAAAAVPVADPQVARLVAAVGPLARDAGYAATLDAGPVTSANWRARLAPLFAGAASLKTDRTVSAPVQGPCSPVPSTCPRDSNWPATPRSWPAASP